jgi:hypothetical protein
VDDAAGALRRFDKLNFDACSLQGVGAYEAGDAAANDQRLNVSGHRRQKPRFARNERTK